MILQRLAVTILRLGIAAMFLLVLIEISYVVLGGAERHVWEDFSMAGRGARAPGTPDSVEVWKAASANTIFVLAFAYGGALLVGYVWGILAARWRRVGGKYLLSLIFSVFASVPPFWFAIVVAMYSFFFWKRPGFANDWVVERGPDVLSWWHAAVVALPAFAGAAGWQIRAVSTVLEREASLPYVRGLFYSGYSDENIFYGNVLRRAVPALIRLLDGTLPFVIGCTICVEWAFRYRGIGRLFVEAVRAADYRGVFLGGIWMAVLVCVIMFLREVASGIWKKE